MNSLALFLKCLVALAVCVGFYKGIYSVVKLDSKQVCNMTYSNPNYIPIRVTSRSGGAFPARYGLYLFKQSAKAVDKERLIRNLRGIPVLFIPGSGGSYEQVRSLGKESSKLYTEGPLKPIFHRETWLTPEEGGDDVADFEFPKKYSLRLDWFTADFDDEQSAMDTAILEEHTHYVVLCIHRILDQYKESYKARERKGAATSGTLPESVILVGHSMGGFVARAAVVDPHLRKSAVATIVTLSSPHQHPPLPLQPSYGHYFRRVNRKWRDGYQVRKSGAGHYVSDPVLSQVVVISISGGYNDSQVRTKYESLDGIVPPTHGFMISSTGMKNVWLSMDHQAILWCNQLVVQVSHTLLSLADSRTGKPFSDTRIRLAIFSKMLRSGIPQSLNWMKQSRLSPQWIHVPTRDVKAETESLYMSAACPSNVHWTFDPENDLYIQTTIVTVLAMDGRRRVLDIQKLGSNGRSHFMFVTILAPCFGVRLHLWPEKTNSTSNFPVCIRIPEVTSRMVLIPSVPAPRQTQHASLTSILHLGPEDMRGFRFLTISVATRPNLSGRYPRAVSMAVGQFFNPEEGVREISTWSHLLTVLFHKNLFSKEDHSLSLNLSFTSSLGLLPVTLSLRTAGCGLKSSELLDEHVGDTDDSKHCELHCFPPVAFAWDETSGLHVFTNLYNDTIIVDSSPALWSSAGSSEKTTVLLLVDPQCWYGTAMTVSVTAVCSRFLVVYLLKILGFSVAVILFALKRHASERDSNRPIQILEALKPNLRIKLPYLDHAIPQSVLSVLIVVWLSQLSSSYTSIHIVSVVCYILANVCVAVLILILQCAFHVFANLLVSTFLTSELFFNLQCHLFYFRRIRWCGRITSCLCSLKVARVIRANGRHVLAFAAITLAWLVHPALSVLVVLISQAVGCHTALLRHAGRHVETFNQLHGVFILHLVAGLMFGPSLVTWLQRLGQVQSFPRVWDSFLATGMILHGLYVSHPSFNAILVPLPLIGDLRVRMCDLYCLAGYCSFVANLASTPYQLEVVAALGYIFFAVSI